MSTSYQSTDQLQTRPPARRPISLRETLALIFITVGSIVFIVFGWIVGVVLLWTSTVWTTREKLIGTFVLPGGLAPAFLLMTSPVGSYSCASTTVRVANGVVHHGVQVCEVGGALPHWLGWLLQAVLVLAPIITAIWLGRVAVRRANAA